MKGERVVGPESGVPSVGRAPTKGHLTLKGAVRERVLQNHVFAFLTVPGPRTEHINICRDTFMHFSSLGYALKLHLLFFFWQHSRAQRQPRLSPWLGWVGDPPLTPAVFTWGGASGEGRGHEGCSAVTWTLLCSQCAAWRAWEGGHAVDGSRVGTGGGRAGMVWAPVPSPSSSGAPRMGRDGGWGRQRLLLGVEEG